jgi:hypothetical protein
VKPTEVEHGAENQYVDPVTEQRGAEDDKLGDQLGGERHDGHCEQEHDVDPGEMPVRAGEAIELRLLPIPKNAESQEAHHVGGKLRRHGAQRALQIPLGVDSSRAGPCKSRTSSVIATANMPSLSAAWRSTLSPAIWQSSPRGFSDARRLLLRHAMQRP